MDSMPVISSSRGGGDVCDSCQQDADFQAVLSTGRGEHMRAELASGAACRISTSHLNVAF